MHAGAPSRLARCWALIVAIAISALKTYHVMVTTLYTYILNFVRNLVVSRILYVTLCRLVSVQTDPKYKCPLNYKCSAYQFYWFLHEHELPIKPSERAGTVWNSS